MGMTTSHYCIRSAWWDVKSIFCIVIATIFQMPVWVGIEGNGKLLRWLPRRVPISSSSVCLRPDMPQGWNGSGNLLVLRRRWWWYRMENDTAHSLSSCKSFCVGSCANRLPHSKSSSAAAVTPSTSSVELCLLLHLCPTRNTCILSPCANTWCRFRVQY